MLLQLRVTVPPDRTDRVRELFENDAGTAHLAVLPGASVSPAGAPGTDSGPEVGDVSDDPAGAGSPATEHGPQ